MKPNAVPQHQAGRNPVAPGDRPAWERSLLARLQEASEGYSYREVADLTGIHPETVRRYLTKGRPPAYFVAAFCSAMQVSPAWLVFGTGHRPDKAPKASGFLEEPARGKSTLAQA